MFINVIMQLSFFEFFCLFENRLSYPFDSHLPWYPKNNKERKYSENRRTYTFLLVIYSFYDSDRSILILSMRQVV